MCILHLKILVQDAVPLAGWRKQEAQSHHRVLKPCVNGVSSTGKRLHRKESLNVANCDVLDPKLGQNYASASGFHCFRLPVWFQCTGPLACKAKQKGSRGMVAVPSWQQSNATVWYFFETEAEMVLNQWIPCCLFWPFEKHNESRKYTWLGFRSQLCWELSSSCLLCLQSVLGCRPQMWAKAFSNSPLQMFWLRNSLRCFKGAQMFRIFSHVFFLPSWAFSRTLKLKA